MVAACAACVTVNRYLMSDLDPFIATTPFTFLRSVTRYGLFRAEIKSVSGDTPCRIVKLA
jgi:hypothetical protein